MHASTHIILRFHTDACTKWSNEQIITDTHNHSFCTQTSHTHTNCYIQINQWFPKAIFYYKSFTHLKWYQFPTTDSNSNVCQSVCHPLVDMGLFAICWGNEEKKVSTEKGIFFLNVHLQPLWNKLSIFHQSRRTNISSRPFNGHHDEH